MSAPINVLAVLDREIDCWPNPEQHADGKRLIAARAAIAELIEACRERDAAQAAWASSAERQRQEPGPFYQRSRAADARYTDALAAVGPQS